MNPLYKDLTRTGVGETMTYRLLSLHKHFSMPTSVSSEYHNSKV